MPPNKHQLALLDLPIKSTLLGLLAEFIVITVIYDVYVVKYFRDQWGST
jgi:hypothetical protein